MRSHAANSISRSCVPNRGSIWTSGRRSVYVPNLRYCAGQCGCSSRVLPVLWASHSIVGYGFLEDVRVARSRVPLVKTRDFGMTQLKGDSENRFMR